MEETDLNLDDNQDNSDNQGFVINDVNEVLGEYKDDPVFKPYSGQKPDEFIRNIVKGYANAQSMIGGEKVALPVGKLDTPENWEALYKKLGRPKDANGYQFEKPQLPEGMSYDEDFEKAFKSECHKAGILPKQAVQLYNFYNSKAIDGFQKYTADMQQKEEEAMTTLRNEFKTQVAFDQAVKGANDVLYAYAGGKETAERIVDKFQHDPDLIRLLSNISKVMSEDAIKLGEKRFDLTGGDVKTKLDGILYDKSNAKHEAYFKKDHPKHNEVVAEVASLMEQLHGTE